MKKPKHSFTWQDEEIVGLTCDGKEAGTLDAQDDEGRECPRCGRLLRLMTHTFIEEVKKP